LKNQVEKAGKNHFLNRLRKQNAFGPFLIFTGLFILVWFLTDILQINNTANRWVFVTDRNILSVVKQVAQNSIVAFGMTMIIIVLGIDLSAGAMLALNGVFFVACITTFGMPLAIAILLTLIIGSFMGFLNGIITSVFKLPAFVVTLGTGLLYRGLALFSVNGDPIFCDDPSFLFIANGDIIGIPFPIIILVIATLAYYYLLSKTRFGMHVYALGGNEQTARMSGINVIRTRTIIYTIAGFGTAVSSMILASRIGSGQPMVSMQGYELNAITAAVIGGTSMAGGTGTIFATLAGALIIGIIDNGMNLLYVPPYWQDIVKGFVVLFAILIDSLRRSRSK